MTLIKDMNEDRLVYIKLSSLISAPLRVEFEENKIHLHRGMAYTAIPVADVIENKEAYLRLVGIINSILQDKGV